MNNPLLKIYNLSKNYGTKRALDTINIKIEKGTIYGLIGQNGAGKTTLIRILNKIIEGDEGEVLFKNKLITAKDVQYIGYLPEERGLYKNMSIEEQAMYFGQLKGMTKSQAKIQLKYWLQRFEILDWKHKKIQDLSKGMAQKVQFIITVLHQPDLLILDEPFSGFDPINAQVIAHEIKNLSKQGTTILFSSHRMESVTEMCNAICLLHNGKVLLDGSIDAIQQKYAQEIYEVSIQNFKEDKLVELMANPNYKTTIIFKNETILKMEIFKNNKEDKLLNELLNIGKLILYKQHVPNLQEIFIKTIQDA